MGENAAFWNRTHACRNVHLQTLASSGPPLSRKMHKVLIFFECQIFLFWAISLEAQRNRPNRRRTKCTEHANTRIRPTKRLEHCIFPDYASGRHCVSCVVLLPLEWYMSSYDFLGKVWSKPGLRPGSNWSKTANFCYNSTNFRSNLANSCLKLANSWLRLANTLVLVSCSRLIKGVNT